MTELKQEKLFDLDLISISDLTNVSESIFLDKQKPEIPGKKFIVFMLEDKQYAIASNEVSEVVRPLTYTTLPNLPEWLLGIANLRGDIISIIDLQILWFKEVKETPKAKFIILRSEKSDSRIAFKVSKLREIVTLQEDEIEEVNSAELPYIFGSITHKSNTIHLLNVEEILTSLKLKNK